MAEKRFCDFQMLVLNGDMERVPAILKRMRERGGEEGEEREGRKGRGRRERERERENTSVGM